MATWEEIRSNWVNGNLQDAKDQLYQGSKNRILINVAEAIDRFIEGSDIDTHTGDLKDLREIINSITRR